MIFLAAVLSNVWLFVAPNPSDGRQELQVYVSPDFEGVTGDTIVVDAGYGLLIKDRLLISGLAMLKTVEDIAPGEKDYRFRELDVACEYLFKAHGSFQPYVRVLLGMAWLNYINEKQSGLTFGAGTGLKFMLTDSTAIDLALTHRSSNERVFINDFKLQKADLEIRLGLRVRF